MANAGTATESFQLRDTKAPRSDGADEDPSSTSVVTVGIVGMAGHGLRTGEVERTGRSGGTAVEAYPPLLPDER